MPNKKSTEKKFRKPRKKTSPKKFQAEVKKDLPKAKKPPPGSMYLGISLDMNSTKSIKYRN